MSAICEFCGFEAPDMPTEIAHMTTWHPDIVAERLSAVGEHITPEAIRASAGPPVPEPSITCPECAMTSYNPNDIRHGYCGNCHRYTSDGNPYATFPQ